MYQAYWDKSTIKIKTQQFDELSNRQTKTERKNANNRLAGLMIHSIMKGKMTMQVTPVRTVTSVTAVPDSAAESQRLEKNTYRPRLIVARRQDPGLEDTPQDALDKAQRERKAVEKAAENLNKFMGLIDKKLEFVVHDETRRTIIQVVHSDSGQVLSEFPSKKMLDLYASLVEAIGIAVDEKI